MKKNNFLVSIITPSYNQGAFIEDTILSVKNQRYPYIEHIIIDGGSTDNTLKIIKKYDNTYNLTWISEADQGQANAIVKGLARINGSIVTWINTDDFYIDDTVIEKVVHYFKAKSEIDVVTGSGYWVNEKKAILGPIIADKKLITGKYMQYADFILQPSTFFRRRILDTITIEQQYVYVFDWLLFLKMFENKCSFLVVDDYFSAYRTHKENKTGQDNAQRKKEIFNVVRRNLDLKSLQTIYCYLIYFFYVISEMFPKPVEKFLKFVIRVFNYCVKRLSGYHLYSC